MDKWFESKWFIRGVSLVFAILLSVVVNFEESTTHQDARIPGDVDADRIQTLHDVPVNIKIDSEKYVVSGAQKFASVSFEGPNSVLIPTVMQRNFDFFIDLRDRDEGTHTVDILYSNVPDELNVYIEPKTIPITIEERVSEEFNVQVDFINMDQLPDGYEIDNLEVNPEVVTITSSRSVYEQISMVKAYIDVTGLTESINNREVPINVYDGQGNVLAVRIEPETVVISADVDNPSKEVPVELSTIHELPENITDFTMTTIFDEIEIFAISEILKEIESIQTEDIDLGEVTASGEMDVKLDLPEGVIADHDTIPVTIEVEKTATFEEVPIQYDEPNAGQNIAFISPSEPFMSVTVSGNDREIDELEQEDFRLLLDAKNLSEGEHQVPITVDGPDHVKTSLEHEEIVIRIVSPS